MVGKQQKTTTEGGGAPIRVITSPSSATELIYTSNDGSKDYQIIKGKKPNSAKVAYKQAYDGTMKSKKIKTKEFVQSVIKSAKRQGYHPANPGFYDYLKGVFGQIEDFSNLKSPQVTTGDELMDLAKEEVGLSNDEVKS